MKTAQANRGRGLEDLVAVANDQYLARGIAKVRKLPTPYQIVRRGQRMEAIPAKRSGLDYIGVVQGRAVTFDCKQTRQASFPLRNILEHQLQEAREWEANGGNAFWLIEFRRFDLCYRVPHTGLTRLIELADEHGRKSIPHDWMRSEWVVRSRAGLILDYLAGMYEVPKEVEA